MSKNKFNAGDRVRAYMGNTIKVGKIIDIGPTLMQISYGINEGSIVHPKQCRRLVKKKRREWWININRSTDDIYSTRELADNSSSERIECVHVREVKK